MDAQITIDYRGIVFDILAEAGSWRRVAEVLVPHGCSQSCAAWHRVAYGKIRLNRESKNALLSYAGLPPLPPDAALMVAEHDVTRVVMLVEEPNVALMAHLGAGQSLAEARLYVQKGKIETTATPPRCTVTVGYRPPRRRKARQACSVYLPAFDASQEQITRRGKTVNFEAVGELLVKAAGYMNGEDVADYTFLASYGLL